MDTLGSTEMRHCKIDLYFLSQYFIALQMPKIESMALDEGIEI